MLATRDEEASKILMMLGERSMIVGRMLGISENENVEDPSCSHECRSRTVALSIAVGSMARCHWTTVYAVCMSMCSVSSTLHCWL